MYKKEFSTIGEYFYWIYSNMSMAHVALQCNHMVYERSDFMIRSRLYKGLCSGKMNIHSLYDDEKTKLNTHSCCYCGSLQKLSIDHLIPRKMGGTDCADNLIYCCKSCNSSKNKTDLIEWCLKNNNFPPILILRRYLKLAYVYLSSDNILDLPFSELKNHTDIFRLNLLACSFPSPSDLRL